MVKLMVDKLVVVTVGGWDGGERKGEKIKWRKPKRRAKFFQFLHPIFFMFRP
jgi:hypothetical protein